MHLSLKSGLSRRNAGMPPFSRKETVMTKILFAVLAAFAVQVAGGAAFASQEAVKPENAISSPVASCCGAGKDKDKKDKDSRKNPKSSVLASTFRPACGESCDSDRKDEKQEPRSVVACGKDKDKKDKDGVKQPASVMACSGTCDSKEKDDRQEPKSVRIS
jgi:hypothetical protein